MKIPNKITRLTTTTIKNTTHLNLALFVALIITLNPLLNAECTAFNENQSPTNVFNELVSSFTEQEVQEFNNRINSNSTLKIIQRLSLALMINIGIYTIVQYGPTIYNYSVEFLQAIPEAVSNTITFLFETARESALRSFNNANPEERIRMLNIAREIIANRTTVPPSA